jgi:hypothetical protein
MKLDQDRQIVVEKYNSTERIWKIEEWTGSNWFQ